MSTSGVDLQDMGTVIISYLLHCPHTQPVLSQTCYVRSPDGLELVWGLMPIFLLESCVFPGVLLTFTPHTFTDHTRSAATQSNQSHISHSDTSPNNQLVKHYKKSCFDDKRKFALLCVMSPPKQSCSHSLIFLSLFCH